MKPDPAERAQRWGDYAFTCSVFMVFTMIAGNQPWIFFALCASIGLIISMVYGFRAATDEQIAAIERDDTRDLDRLTLITQAQAREIGEP